VHTELEQSLGARQVWFVPHLPHEVPPQSLSVSAPFFTPSEHDGLWQTFVLHTPLVQSAGTRHF
jgi:hypothetical protein